MTLTSAGTAGSAEFDLYQGIGSFSELAARSGAYASRLKVNAHIHLPPNFSAFETVEQAVRMAATENVCVLGANNYYDYSVYKAFASECGKNGIAPLFGAEIICLIEELRAAGVKINDPGNPGKMYVCGKGITRFSPLSATAYDLLATIRNNDSTRVAQMIGRLSDAFTSAGVPAALDENAVIDMVVARHGSPASTVYLQERHVAQAFQELLFNMVPSDSRADVLARLFGCLAACAPDDAVGVQNEIRSHLMKAGKRGFVPETFVDFDHAYRLILALGGIPCYPTLVDGASPICGYEADVDELIAATQARGIFCTELIPIRNSPEQVLRSVRSMRQAGFIVTAGTEHNTRDLIPMAPTCVRGAEIPEEAQQIFWEGACVVAAHQYLTCEGRPGYVDDAGRLAGEYISAEARIEFLRELGAEVIHEVVGRRA